MTRYMEIFKEIVDIVHHDYAGYDEKRGWDEPAHYFREIERLISGQQITPEFLRISSANISWLFKIDICLSI